MVSSGPDSLLIGRLIPKAKCSPKGMPVPYLISGVIMEARDYESAYYQIQDDVLASLPVEMDEEAYLD